MPGKTTFQSRTLLAFLSERVGATPVSIALAIFYLWSGWPNPTGSWFSFGLIAAWLAIQAFRPPRGVSSALLLTGFAFHIWQMSVVEASLPMFSSATRDLAAIDSVRAIARGHSPWSFVKGYIVTTGPASILGLAPAVLMTGNLKAITFLFWITVPVVFVTADVMRLSDRASSLTLLLMLDRAAMPHTLHWRLDELYFPVLLLVLAFFALRARRMFIAGLAIAVAPLCRLNYAFLVLALLLWGFWNLRPSRRELVRGVLAAVSATLVVLVPFVLLGGREFFRTNPFTTAMGMSVGAAQSTLAGLLAGHISPIASTVVRVGFTVVAIVIVAWVGRNATHPFWIITFASLAAHTIVWTPGVRRIEADYTLIVLLPALLGAAFAGAPKAQSFTS